MVQVQEKSHLLLHAFIAFIAGFTMFVVPFVWFLIKFSIKGIASIKDEKINVPFGNNGNLGD